ncbi:bi-domain-containing oxidoreductase [Cytophagales bacterium LB-30]|uniref:Bi-domain-containing oxidoreductase n=1 Tax=Shiella aurantiaca TaxID=3058365 RepID=A0ABT8F2M1_9BACT|nr:bi-domain-containing oxidoreductase [Shiella aurantiaca]MDN4164633.1 bi-domain-containing oxidoreductase [Shiella aurantiaca]
MKQIVQNLKSGETILEDVPMPQSKRGHVLIRTTRTLISAGTERMLVEFGKANFIEKARQQPDKVKQVLDKMKTDGVGPTLDAVFNKLNQPLPLGYCNVGEVVAVGKDVFEFSVGDRVVSNGPHAEFVNVPKNLVAKIPDGVTDNQAAFTVISAIGLQGIRLCNPTFGETIVVTGLGLIGLITAQLLVAQGCNVIGFDFDENKVKLAKSKGVNAVNLADGVDPVQFVLQHTNGVGADGVIITASNKSNDIIAQSAHMSRKRGRIILIGVIGLELSRADFYEKELSFQVSCSYGPGRYDEDYEQNGIDYPLPFVRWTEKRNFEAVLGALASGRLQVDDLISEEVDLEGIVRVYEGISSSKSIATIIRYSSSSSQASTIELNKTDYTVTNGVIGIIGAGNFTSSTILPALKKAKAPIKAIASAAGLSGTILAKKYGISQSTSDYQTMLKDAEIDSIFITTRHNMHASMATESLHAGKHIFVEKPLALNQEELNSVLNAQAKTGKNIMVGFNRRFSPHVQEVKRALGNNSGPINVNATMNAGFIPADVWVHDMQVGGGRIIGEACHYMDLLVYLTGSPITRVCMSSLGEHPEDNTDNASILLQFKNGSNGVINYFSNGSKAYSKERVEVYSNERTAIIDNFRKTSFFGFKKSSDLRTKLDKGHTNQFNKYVNFLKRGGEGLIPQSEIINVTLASFAAIKSLKEKAWINVE